LVQKKIDSLQLEMASSDLASYQLQLQQVAAALTADPENSELLTLKTDLEQVIDLTNELITAQAGEIQPEPKLEKNSGYEKSNRKSSEFETSATAEVDEYKEDEVEDVRQPIKHWQVGEQCQTLWHKDAQYHDATIEEITTDGEVTVRFKNYKEQTAVTKLTLLKAPSSGTAGPSSSKNKKEELAKHKEYLKKKKAKKAERFKKMDEQREDEKSKWQNFSGKAFGKRGFVKKSIFKTPENAQGRVGIGTCGVSGQKMTNFSAANKYRRGT